jgi:hypothetical protein
MADKVNAYCKKNELMRIESFEKLEPKLEVPLLTFFRRIGFPHVHHELCVPALAEGGTLGIIAVKDRAWPPWGIGAHTIHALALASPISAESAGVSNVFALEEDVCNIGLIAGVYKELLVTLIRRGIKEITYIVLEGSVFSSRVLTNIGFRATEELFLSHGSRYIIHSCEPRSHLEAMGLDKAPVPELLEGNFGDDTFSMLVQWIAATSLGSLSFWSERGGMPEVIPNTGGFLRASQPGGVPIRRHPV